MVLFFAACDYTRCVQRPVSLPLWTSFKVRPHYAAWQNATHCSFAARQKLLGICRQCDRVHMKKEFFTDLLQVPKLLNEIGKLGLIFFSNWLIPFWNPLLIICRTASFDGTDNLPIEFLGRTTSNGMLQPSWHNIHVYLWHGATFGAWPCRTLPLCAARYSVDVPLGSEEKYFSSPPAPLPFLKP